MRNENHKYVACESPECLLVITTSSAAVGGAPECADSGAPGDGCSLFI